MYCLNDTWCTAGVNGRCYQEECDCAPACTYDTCATDSDCAQGVCACGAPVPNEGRLPNVCVPSNCYVDANCGDGGYCSPSPHTGCGPWVIAGYYCHTPQDECTNDDQCAGSLCTWAGNLSKWVCTGAGCNE
jgi:hypothetical protein